MNTNNYIRYTYNYKKKLYNHRNYVNVYLYEYL